MKLFEKSLSSKTVYSALKGIKYPILLFINIKFFFFSIPLNDSFSEFLFKCVDFMNSSTFLEWPSINIDGIKASNGLFINSGF